MPFEDTKRRLFENWDQLCSHLDPVTASERPYKVVGVYPPSSSSESETPIAVVELPMAPLPKELTDQESDPPIPGEGEEINFSDTPENETRPLPDSLATIVEEIFTHVEEQIESSSGESPPVTIERSQISLTEDELCTILSIHHQVPPESELHSVFQTLMEELGYVSDGSIIGGANHVAPTYVDGESGVPQLTMAATAYKEVPDPHSYWSDCDTLDEYIDMCVESNDDLTREEFASRDTYPVHFHPVTEYKNDLPTSHKQSLQDWREAIEEQVNHIEFHTDPVFHYFSNVQFESDGSGTITVRVGFGDDSFSGHTIPQFE